MNKKRGNSDLGPRLLQFRVSQCLFFSLTFLQNALQPIYNFSGCTGLQVWLYIDSSHNVWIPVGLTMLLGKFYCYRVIRPICMHDRWFEEVKTSSRWYWNSIMCTGFARISCPTPTSDSLKEIKLVWAWTDHPHPSVSGASFVRPARLCPAV
jgi:hypothetical protein